MQWSPSGAAVSFTSAVLIAVSHYRLHPERSLVATQGVLCWTELKAPMYMLQEV